jgi:hypothetical protein
MFKLRSALDVQKKTLQNVLASSSIEEEVVLNCCRDIYESFTLLDSFIDPVSLDTIRDIADSTAKLALRIDTEQLQVWTDFVSLLTNSMWSPTTFSFFIVYCRAMTICDKQNKTEMNEDFDTAFEKLRRRVGIEDAEVEVIQMVRFVSTHVDVERISGSHWFDGNGNMKREGTRILEKAWLLQLATHNIAQELEHYTEETLEEYQMSEEFLEEWSLNCIENTLGSDILSSIDQWCTVFCLKPLDIWIAGGERGACPHDVLNDVPSWVMRSVQAEKLSQESLRHMQCILCFGILLQQRFSFDWFRLCFLSAVNPMQKIRVLRLYRDGPDLKPPPLVVQMDVEHYIVIIKNPMVCIRLQGKNSGYRAVNAWCELIIKHRNCLFSRKKNIYDIITRIRNG